MPIAEQPFAATAKKYEREHANGKISGSNYPYHEIRSLPGYPDRHTPGLAAVDVTKELAIHLMDYAKTEGDSLQYQKRDVTKYLWMQASRGMLAWSEILNVVRANRKRDGHQQVSHYFGYPEVVGQKGVARYKRLIKLIRYITQEGICAGCQIEFQFDLLTLDRIKPGKLGGEYKLPNVQVMCGRCNNALKKDSYKGRHIPE